MFFNSPFIWVYLAVVVAFGGLFGMVVMYLHSTHESGAFPTYIAKPKRRKASKRAEK